jgi:threonine aldolase
VDGARFANAFATLKSRETLSPADTTWRVGVDALCLGGTKNGMNTTEAVVFFNPALAREFEYRCKQAGQLASKMRLQSAQWVGMLETGAWLKNAQHANRMASLLATGLREIPGVTLARNPDANAVFAQMPDESAERLTRLGWHFYNFIGAQGYRLMCSWATQPADIEAFLADVRRVI